MENIDNPDNNNIDNTNNNIDNWNILFIKYCDCEKKCVDNINAIGNIKKNLKNLLGNQKNDDLMFYRSLIESSYFYLTNSLKIKKTKFVIYGIIYYCFTINILMKFPPVSGTIAVRSAEIKTFLNTIKIT